MQELHWVMTLYDTLCGPIFDSFNHIFRYMGDYQLTVKRNRVQGTNEFGTRFLNLCNSTGLRIMNGRHKDGLANDFSYILWFKGIECSGLFTNTKSEL